MPESESETHEEEDECDEDVVRNVYPFGGGTDADGLYQGCRSEYQQRIGQVRTTTLPIAMPPFPSIPAMRLTTSSGIEVPMPRW